MAEEEILKINQKLQKMIEKSEVDESLARDLLNRLHDIRITLNILQRTGIGKTVNNLRRVIANEDLSTVAKGLLKNWKKLVPEPSSTPKDREDRPSASASSSNNSQGFQESNLNNGKSSDTKKSNERQTISSSKSVLALNTEDEYRLKSRDLLIAALSISEIPEGSADPVDLAARIEDAIYRELKDTGMKYCNRIRSRVANLKDAKNPNLRIKVLIGTITPERLAVLTAEEMASDALKEERSKLTTDAINGYQLAEDEGNGTDLIQCSRCKQNNCAYTEAQTRSADEPMTLFVLCKNCGNRWKM